MAKSRDEERNRPDGRFSGVPLWRIIRSCQQAALDRESELLGLGYERLEADRSAPDYRYQVIPFYGAMIERRHAPVLAMLLGFPDAVREAMLYPFHYAVDADPPQRALQEIERAIERGKDFSDASFSYAA